MKLNKTKIGLIAILVAIILAIGLFGSGCVSGMAPIGWSGGTVANGILYVGFEGRLEAVNLTDNSPPQPAEALKTVTQTGMFGCSGGLGCGTTTSTVQIYGAPAVSDNLVYVAGYNGRIYAYNTSNLATRWVYPRDDFLRDDKNNVVSIVGGIVAAQGNLYFDGSDGKVYALDAVTGDYKWDFQTGDKKTVDKIWGTPAVEDGTLYIGSFDKKLYAIDAATGKEKWDKPFETQGAIIATPLVYNGVVYIGSFDKYLYAIDAITGKEMWKFPGENWFWAQPVIVDGTVYAGCLDGFVYAIDIATGKGVDKFIDTATGEGIDKVDLKSPVPSQPVILDKYIVFASRDGIIYKIDSVSREFTTVTNLKMNVDGPLTAYEGNIYVHTYSGGGGCSGSIVQKLERVNVVTGDTKEISFK